MKLNRRIKRNIKSNMSFYICCTILTMLTCLLIICSSSTGKSLNSLLKGFLSNNKVEDAEFYTMKPIPPSKMQNLEKKFHVTIEESTFYDAKVHASTLRIYKPMNKINLYKITKGKDISSNNEILISQRYAETNNLTLGDNLNIKGGKFKIVGYMVKADYVYMLKDLSSSYYDYKAFGDAIISSNALKKINGSTSYYSVRYLSDNNLAFRKKINKDYNIISYLSKGSNPRIKFTMNDGDKVSSISMRFAPVLFIIVMAITALILSRKVKGERKQIGILSALGYRKSELIRHYSSYATIPGILGSILGIILGILCIKPFSNFYLGDFEILPYTVHVQLASIIVSLFIPTLLYVTVSVLVVWKLVKHNTTELLTGNTDEKDKTSKKLFRNNKIKFKTKYRFRLILGHLSRTLVITLGVVISSTCILTGFAMKDAINNAAKYNLNSSGYTNLYYLNTLIKDIPNDAEGILTKSFEVKNNSTLFNMWGIDKSPKYLNIKLLSGNEMKYGKYYITNAAAKAYKIKKGDNFTFYDISTAEKHTISIADIVDENTNYAIYTSKKNVSTLCSYSVSGSNLLISNKNINVNNNIVMRKSSKSDLQKSLKNITGIFISVCYIIILIGFGLGLMVMYLITNIIVEENKVNISMLKVLGYHQKEINSLVLNTNHILVILGYLLSIPATIVFCKFGFANSSNSMGMYIPVNISTISYLLCLAIVVLAYILSLSLLKQKTLRVNMVECLKDSRE